MNIIETNLSFGSMSNRSSTRRIIIHHAEAKSCTAEQIHAWHKANGWSGAGYHFLVRKDGNVYRLRPENKVGAHASGANSDSIGICFEGTYNTETMPQAQLQAGRDLLAYLKGKYGNLPIIKHKDVCATDCPGKVFPFDALVNGVGTSTPTPSTPTPSQPDKPTQSTTTSNFGGVYRCNVDKLNVRDAPSLSGSVMASYKRGETVTLDNWYKIADGYVWGRYTGASSGRLRYVAVGKATGKPEPNDYLIKI